MFIGCSNYMQPVSTDALVPQKPRQDIDNYTLFTCMYYLICIVIIILISLQLYKKFNKLIVFLIYFVLISSIILIIGTFVYEKKDSRSYLEEKLADLQDDLHTMEETGKSKEYIQTQDKLDKLIDIFNDKKQKKEKELYNYSIDNRFNEKMEGLENITKPLSEFGEANDKLGVTHKTYGEQINKLSDRMTPERNKQEGFLLNDASANMSYIIDNSSKSNNINYHDLSSFLNNNCKYNNEAGSIYINIEGENRTIGEILKNPDQPYEKLLFRSGSFLDNNGNMLRDNSLSHDYSNVYTDITDEYYYVRVDGIQVLHMNYSGWLFLFVDNKIYLIEKRGVIIFDGNEVKTQQFNNSDTSYKYIKTNGLYQLSGIEVNSSNRASGPPVMHYYHIKNNKNQDEISYIDLNQQKHLIGALQFNSIAIDGEKNLIITRDNKKYFVNLENKTIIRK